MTRTANRLLFVALLACGAGNQSRAEEPGNGDGAVRRQSSITVRQPAGDAGTTRLQALRCRRYFGCLPTGVFSLDINRDPKGIHHDRP
jgi:hypothetical protein